MPRFLFYMQVNFKPVAKYLQDDMTKQSTKELRIEVEEWIANLDKIILAKEEESKKRDTALDKKIENLQE